MTESQSTPRLVHLADYGSEYPGSFVSMIRCILGAASARGWRAEAVFNPAARERAWAAELEERGVRVRFAPPRPREDARSYIAGLLAEERRPTILHTHMTAYDIPAVQAARHSGGTRVFWHNHMGPTRRPGTVARNVVKYLTVARGVEQMLCVAPDAVAVARRRGAPRGRVRFFPNAIDTASFPLADASARTAVRAELGVPPDAAMLLHFGWDWLRKGGDVLLAAARVLHDAGVPFRVVTVGAPAAADELAADLGIGDSVLAIPPRSQVADLYAGADVFMSPSRSEGLTYSVAEALCAGVPVVGSRIPGQEWVAPGASARRLTGFDPGEIAAAVRELLARPEGVAAADSEEGRRWVLENMDLAAWAERLMGLYEPASRGGYSR